MLTDVNVERLDYQLERVLEKDTPPSRRAEIERMLPPPDHLLSFTLLGSTTAMANAIRRAGMFELLNAALTADIEGIRTRSLRTTSRGIGSVQTREPLPDFFFIPAYFLLRLHHIKIPPETEDTYELRVENRTDEVMVVYSKSLKSKSGRENPFPGTHRLGKLSPFCALDVETITVEKGYGYHRSHFFTTGKYRFATLDYRPVNVIGSNGRSDTVWVGKQDVLAYGRPKPLKPKDSRELLALAPLFVPRRFMEDKEALKEKLSDWEDVRVVDALPAVRNSMTVRCRNYYLEFRLEAAYDPQEHLPRIFATLLERLERVKEQLPRLVQVLAPAENEKDGWAKLIMTVEGEDHTMGELLREKIFDLDSSCFVNCMTHPRKQRTLILRLAHPAAEALLGKSVEACIMDVRALQEQANGRKK